MIALSNMRQTPNKSQQPFNEIKAQLAESEKEKQKYRELAEAREFTIDTILQPSIEIMQAQGIVVTMIGEVTAYGIKQGRNEKYQESMDRLTKLTEFIQGFSKISDHNFQLRYMLAQSIRKRDDLQEENLKLKQQLEAINKAWNAE